MRHLFATGLIILFSCFLNAPISAQETLLSPSPQAKPLNIIANLTLGVVNTVFQSSQGIIWLGTDEGLVRYDGYNAKRYVNALGDRNSLSHNKVMGIVEDAEHNLWISTYGGGLNLFSAKTGHFIKIDLRRPFDEQPFTDFLSGLTLDKENTLWIGSDSGLNRLDIVSQKALELPVTFAPLNRVISSGVFIDSQQAIWVPTRYSGIYWFSNGQMHHFGQENSSLTTKTVRKVTEDKQGNIWLGTAQGLHRFDRVKHHFSPMPPKLDAALDLSNHDIISLKFDHLGHLWLGTRTNGVYLYFPESQQFQAISGERDFFQHYTRDNINDIFTDNDGSLWLATEQGVILVTRTGLNIRYLTNATAKMPISDIEPLTDNKASFAGNYQFYDYNIANNTATARFVDENRIYRITADNDDNLWFATLGQGLQHYTLADDQLSQLPHAKALYSGAPITGLFDAYIDRMKKVWLLPFPDLPNLAGGILRFDLETMQYETYLSSPFISDILQITDNQLLLCSDSAGLITLNIDTKVATRWQQTITSTPRRVFTLLQDSQNNLWLGTRDQGLALFNPQSQSFSFITTANGLLSNTIYSIVEDDEHQLWLGSAEGLSRFNPQTQEIFNVERQDGLLFSSFYKSAVAKTSNGQIIMGSHQGLVTFDPRDFSQPSPAISVIISDLKVFNQSVDWRSNKENNILQKPIESTEQLVLSPQDYMFSFSFAALEYIRPDKIQFAYKMEGLDENWVYTDATNRIASYTTLPADDYVFRVKATNREGVWNEQAAQIKVTILAPWWLSWPAYVAYLLVATTCVYLFITYRTKKLVERATELEDNVAQRTHELQHSRDQVTKLLAQKQELFASVSHEFRTPLTLILSPIEYLLSDKKGQHITKELSLIKRNGRRLLRMVDQLLEFAKLELKDDTQMECVSLKQTLGIIVSSFEPLVQSKNIGLTVNSFDDAILNMLPDSLNKILINLLSNAFKYSPANSQISIMVTHCCEQVAIAISDTGIGIGESDLELVFQRFNRATHAHGESIPGAGIGLALVKELVEANQGQITLTSVLHLGSTFTVTLPASESGNTVLDASNASHQAFISDHIDLELDSISPSEPQIENIELADDDKRKSILIVDDNSDLRNLLYQQLSDKYQCILAENGQIGLDIAREQLPDLVVSDIMMPVMDGYQLTKALKSNEMTSHIPVILLTAKGSMESRLKGLQLLVDDYLAKPFNIEELTLRIHNILTIRDIVKQRYRQIIDDIHPQAEMDKLNINQVEQTFINKVNELLAEHHTDAEFSAKILSQALFISERQLQRKLKAQFDLGFPELLRNYRLNKAVEMLADGQRVSQIYHSVGFASHSYFSSCFRAKFGKTPKAYQQEL